MKRAARRVLPSFGDRLSLGTQGLRVSPFCLGIVHDPRVVPAAIERGINFFFLSADMHWSLYDATRRGLADALRGDSSLRDRIVVAAVSYVADPEFMLAPFFEVLDAVHGLGHIDLVLAGGVRANQGERLAGFESARSTHQIPTLRGRGATFHDRAIAAQMVTAGEVDIAFARYNSDHRGAEHDLFPKVDDERSTLLFNFKSTGGYVSPKRLDALGFDRASWRPAVSDHYRFVMSRPEVDGILCAVSNVDELDALQQATAQGPLAPDEIKYLKCASDLHRGRVRLASARDLSVMC